MQREQRENPQTGVRTSGETATPPSWLAMICIGQAPMQRETKGGDKMYKERKSSWVGVLALLWGQPALTP